MNQVGRVDVGPGGKKGDRTVDGRKFWARFGVEDEMSGRRKR
jgi:hypothetical protein